MLTYTLKRFDAAGTLKGVGDLGGVDETEVVTWATKLPRSHRYELWCEARLVYQSNELGPEQRPQVSGH